MADLWNWPRWRRAAGAAAAIAAIAVLATLMLPARAYLGSSTIGLILIIPVVVGVAIGGWSAGVVSIAVGFLSYDYLFIRPYYTLAVSNYGDWVTLGVYVVVMLIGARVVSQLQVAVRGNDAPDSSATR